MDIIKILQIGFAGPAFLLAVLSYRLLLIEQKKEEPNPKNHEAINRFMVFALILGGLIFLTPYFPQLLEGKSNPLMDAAIEAAKNREPMEPKFIEQQVAILTDGHNERLSVLHAERDEIESSLRAGVSTATRNYEASLRRTEEYIRDENRNFRSRIQELRSMQ